MRIKEIIYEYENMDEARMHHYKMRKDGCMDVYYLNKQNVFGVPIIEVKYININS